MFGGFIGKQGTDMKKAQSILEYAIIIAVVMAALIGTCVYLQRSMPSLLTFSGPASLTSR